MVYKRKIDFDFHKISKKIISKSFYIKITFAEHDFLDHLSMEGMLNTGVGVNRRG